MGREEGREETLRLILGRTTLTVTCERCCQAGITTPISQMGSLRLRRSFNYHKRMQGCQPWLDDSEPIFCPLLHRARQLSWSSAGLCLASCSHCFCLSKIHTAHIRH